MSIEKKKKEKIFVESAKKRAQKSAKEPNKK
jgi:hypothetical protein